MKNFEEQKLTTTVKYIRISPSKVRRILVQLKGKTTEESIIILKFLPYKAASIISKIIFLAVNNAKKSSDGNLPLKIVESRVDSGPILKRFCPHAQGRGFPIKKQTSHITITF